jgi:hypothetical protein
MDMREKRSHWIVNLFYTCVRSVATLSENMFFLHYMELEFRMESIRTRTQGSEARPVPRLVRFRGLSGSEACVVPRWHWNLRTCGFRNTQGKKNLQKNNKHSIGKTDPSTNEYGCLDAAFALF